MGKSSPLTLPRPYQEVEEGFTTGAVDHDFEVTDSARLVALHINFSDTPDSENMTVSLKNSEGTIVRAYTFDPVDDAANAITKVFEGWRWAKSGGVLNVTYTNTSEHVSNIVACYEYDAK